MIHPNETEPSQPSLSPEVIASHGLTEEAESQIREMCERLLSNPVIEDCTFEIQD